jgi:hypothetical protein
MSAAHIFSLLILALRLIQHGSELIGNKDGLIFIDKEVYLNKHAFKREGN